jgi:hypothetical protein
MRFYEIISEDANPKRQAAIAIAMKKAGKKPKSENIKQGIADEGMLGFLTTHKQSNKQVKPNSEEMRQYFAREKSKEPYVYNKNTTQKPQQVYTKHMEEGYLNEERDARIKRIRELSEGLSTDDLAKVPMFVVNSLKKAAYATGREAIETKDAIQTAFNWGQATPEQKQAAKKQLIDVAKIAAGLALAAGVGHVGAATLGVGHAATTLGAIAKTTIEHLISDIGIEAVAEVLATAGGITIVKNALHDITTSSGHEFEKNLAQQGQPAQAAQAGTFAAGAPKVRSAVQPTNVQQVQRITPMPATRPAVKPTNTPQVKRLTPPVAEEQTQEGENAILSPGTEVTVPHKGKMVPGKIVRYDSGKGIESPAYIVDISEYESLIVPVSRVKQDMDEGENWSKYNHKRVGGMSKKSVSSYRRSHPGSKIQTAVTTKPSKLKKGSKAAARRKSFCARMRGMKKHRTGAKTAHDPNSNINKSLRRWHCESIEELHELVMLAEQFIRNNKK